MADIENKYYQVVEDGDDSRPVTNGRRFKLGAALFCGAGLTLLYMVQNASGSTQDLTNSLATTNLAALFPSQALRSSAMSRPMIPGSGPFKQIALTAMTAQNEGKSIRDVAMMANMDKKTTQVMAEVSKAVTVRAVAAQDMSGVTAPFGFWDPVGLSAKCSEGKLLWFREAELKHGRVAMLATLGILVGEKFHPFFGETNVPSFKVFEVDTLNLFWANLAVFSFFFESVTIQGQASGGEMKAGYVPGDLQWDPLGLKPKDEKAFKEMQTKELNNGRLAMFASLGMLAQEMVTNAKLESSDPTPLSGLLR